MHDEICIRIYLCVVVIRMTWKLVILAGESFETKGNTSFQINTVQNV